MILLLLLGAIALCALSGAVALALPLHDPRGDRVAAGLLSIGALIGGGAAAAVLVQAAGSTGSGIADLLLPAPVAGLSLRLHVDALSAMFLLQTFFVGAAGAIYGLEYWSSASRGGGARQLQVAYGVTVAGLALLFLAGDGLLFLIAWEVAALGAWLAMTADGHDPEVRQAGRLYLFCTKAATLALMGLFGSWWVLTGSPTFGPLTHAPAGILLLALVGFGFKAGIMPLHIWLPGAHGNAPSHVSALMSGVLIKAGIYGLIRMLGLCVDAPAWWGGLVFSLGAISAVGGVVFAIGQHDLKRLLAYHSVENIGIILMGLGMALAARAQGAPALVTLGLAAALLHTWNHGLFKSLLFLSAGAVAHRTGTREIDRLGGLARRMPRTGAAFLLGATAICGLPPMNGFVSELLLYLGFLSEATGQGRGWMLGAVGAPALALTGALALLCFAKVYGVVFLGEPRSPAAARARPIGPLMWGPMAMLAVPCLLIGVLPLTVAPILDAALAAWSAPAGIAGLAPLGPLSGLALGLLALILLIGLGMRRRSQRAPAAVGPTWDCGYARPAPRMQYSASSFAASILSLFAWATFPVRVGGAVGEGPLPSDAHLESHVRDPALDLALLPVAQRISVAMGWLRRAQPRSVQSSLFYLLLAVLFAFALSLGGAVEPL